MNKTRRHANLGNDATWKTPTPCFSQCLKENRLLRAHLRGTSWRESMRLVTLMCAARKKSDRRLWIRWRVFQWRSKCSNAATRWRHFSRSLQCAFMVSRYTSTQSSCSNASLSHQIPLTTEMRQSVSALFDDTLMPRAPQKAVLANAIWTRLPPDIAGPTGEVQHVLDGGALLHCITWPHGLTTYQEICALYCDYLSRNFWPVIVVFDGYHIPSTKYTTRQRRTGGEVGIEVTFTWDVKLTMSKDVFLSNVANKQNMLSHYLQLAECLTEHAEEDADLLIAQTAVQSAATKNIVLVADDTDLVILLCYYTQTQMASTCSCSFRHVGQRRRTASGISKSPKVSWVLTSGTTSCSYTRYWGVTPHPDYGLGKGLSLKRFTSSALFRDKAEQFCKKDATVDDVIDAGEAALVCMYHIISVLRLCPRPLQQRDTTICECTCKYSSGWLSAIWRRQIGGGWQRTRTSSLLWHYFLQHQTSCSLSSDATAQLIAAQPDAVVASTVWSAVSADVSDVPTAPRLI